MSKVFKRPMFRRGGEVGGGIMTGIRNNFQEGTPSPAERIAEALKKFMKNIQINQLIHVSQFLIQGGLRFNVCKHLEVVQLLRLAEAFKEPTAELFQGLGAKEKEKMFKLAMEGEHYARY
jgi:hypothetical protein